MARCTHSSRNIQQFTEICLDCGRNIYETEAEYAASLKREIADLKNKVQAKRTAALEDEKAKLLKELGEDDDDTNYGGW